MDWHIVALAGHLVGFALGVGGATISDITFLNAIKYKRLSIQQYRFLRILSRVVWLGLLILILSGLFMFYLIYVERNGLPLLASARWQAKLSLVVIVFINGLYFMRQVFPSLKKVTDQELTPQSFGTSLWKFAIPGTISILSWYSILILSVLPRTVKIPLAYYGLAYAVLLILGAILSKTILQRLLNKSQPTT